RDVVGGGLLVAFHGRLQRLALGDQALLQRRRQPDATKRVASRLREGELRLRRQEMRSVGALRSGLGVGLDDLAVPEVLASGIAALAGVIGETLASLLRIRHWCRVRV